MNWVQLYLTVCFKWNGILDKIKARKLYPCGVIIYNGRKCGRLSSGQMCSQHLKLRAQECAAYHIIPPEEGCPRYGIKYGILCLVEAVQRERYEIKYNINRDFDHDRFRQFLLKNARKYGININGYISERPPLYNISPLFEVVVDKHHPEEDNFAQQPWEKGLWEMEEEEMNEEGTWEEPRYNLRRRRGFPQYKF